MIIYGIILPATNGQNHKKIFSDSLLTNEMQTNTSIRCYFHPIDYETFKRSVNPVVGEGMHKKVFLSLYLPVGGTKGNGK